MKRFRISAIAPLVAFTLLVYGNPLGAAASRFTPPASPRTTYNFNPGWKFVFGDQTNAVQPDFDDSAWAAVSLPHTYGGRTKGSAELAEGTDTGYIFAFPDVAFVPGAIKAVATKGGKVVAQQEIQTAGEPKAIKLTLHTGPQGLQADGSDVALIDFEVVDTQGRRCPTDEARVDFAVTGPVTWRGGFNAGKLNTTNNRFLDTECGINRVAIRSTLAPGAITVTAIREGLTPAIAKIESKPVEIVGGFQRSLPPTLPGPRSAAR